MRTTRYPEIRVSTRSRNPLALVAVVRQALRRRGVDPLEIRRFSDEVMPVARDTAAVERVCSAWVRMGAADDRTETLT